MYSTEYYLLYMIILLPIILYLLWNIRYNPIQVLVTVFIFILIEYSTATSIPISRYNLYKMTEINKYTALDNIFDGYQIR